MNIICAVFGLWCASAQPHHVFYDPNPTIILPLPAFGVNWKMQFFRKNIPFPDNFSIAFPRALEEARKISEITDYKTEISLPPRTYYIRSPLLIEGHDLSINGNGSTLVPRGSTL